jgi:hypothetical protein
MQHSAAGRTSMTTKLIRKRLAHRVIVTLLCSYAVAELTLMLLPSRDDVLVESSLPRAFVYLCIDQDETSLRWIPGRKFHSAPSITIVGEGMHAIPIPIVWPETVIHSYHCSEFNWGQRRTFDISS